MIAASDFASAIPGIKVFFKGRTSATAEAKTEMRCSYAVCWFPVHQEKPAVLLFFRLVADEDVADKSSEGSFAEGKDDFDTVVRKVFVICVCG